MLLGVRFLCTELVELNCSTGIFVIGGDLQRYPEVGVLENKKMLLRKWTKQWKFHQRIQVHLSSIHTISASYRYVHGSGL